jgi:hypothetical protein
VRLLNLLFSENPVAHNLFPAPCATRRGELLRGIFYRICEDPLATRSQQIFAHPAPNANER